MPDQLTQPLTSAPAEIVAQVEQPVQPVTPVIPEAPAPPQIPAEQAAWTPEQREAHYQTLYQNVMGKLKVSNPAFYDEVRNKKQDPPPEVPPDEYAPQDDIRKVFREELTAVRTEEHLAIEKQSTFRELVQWKEQAKIPDDIFNAAIEEAVTYVPDITRPGQPTQLARLIAKNVHYAMIERQQSVMVANAQAKAAEQVKAGMLMAQPGQTAADPAGELSPEMKALQRMQNVNVTTPLSSIKGT